MPSGTFQHILPRSFNGHGFRTFDSQNTPINRPCKIWFEAFAVCSIKFAFNFIVHVFWKTKCDFEKFIVVNKCKNYLEKFLLRILLHILLSSLELPRRGRLKLTDIEPCKALLFFFLLLSFFGVREEEMVNPQIKTWKSFLHLNSLTFVLES